VSEFEVLDVAHGRLEISVRLRWIAVPGLGDLRPRDGAVWEAARLCRRCGRLGYDNADVDLMEAQRFGIEQAPHLAPGEPQCAECPP